MAALRTMTATEAKLYLRDPGTPIIVLGLPIGLLLVLSLIPGVTEPSAEFGGKVPLGTFIAPLSIAILIAMIALNIFPSYLGNYRDRGILRRLAASPVPPRDLLYAQLIVNLVAAAVVVLLIVVIGRLALGMELPANLPGFTLSALLGAAALFSVGLLISAFAPTQSVGNGIGSVLFFPMLALGGVWVRKEDLPAFLQVVADVLPLGATLNALRETAAGGNPMPLQLLALSGCTVVCGVLAARYFRWGTR
ncbi:ABC transporter permease [Amycolatopsis aidingensis]|uniref:ABC transporter permease n=1 Tax=Amycolatopsis aidingensis TaxID=2842453 RepID=UPI001E53C577|nr:ABC transporter permease [Amycolatopsis aidingensis]